jgi:hypothetical protein
MNRSKALPFLPVLLLVAFSSSSCSGPKTSGGGGGTGNGSIAVTMVADTLPASPSLLTFQVTIASIKFTTSSGTSTTVNLSPALTVDLMRLQTDTVFLGLFPNIPAAQYVSATLFFSGNAKITFLNDSATATISLCPPNTVCPLSVAVSSTPVATVPFTVSQNAVTGIGIDLNLFNTVSISGTPANLVVNFNNANVLTAFTLPRPNSNLAAGQLDLIEDFTGVVSISNQSVTLASAPVTGRGSLTATATSTTFYDPDPTGTRCPTGTTVLANCVSNNEVASMDVILKSDGTLAIQEIEPLLATAQDTVEGIVVSINPSSLAQQFTLVITNLIPAAQSSLIGSLHIGDALTVNLSTSVFPFLVDQKGLPVLNNYPGIFQNFSGQTTTSFIHLGQVVAVHATAPFTASIGSAIASTFADTVTLRWSRFTATLQTASSPAFTILNLPFYFGFPQSTIFTVQTFLATSGSPRVTNFDGVLDGSGLLTARPVAIRALFLENTTNSANPVFFAAKVRQH